MKRTLLFPLLFFVVTTACTQRNDFSKQREIMVQKQIEWRGLTTQKITDAFRKIPREVFVLPEFRDKAYDDLEVPIGEDQTLDRPFEDALMLEALGIDETTRVLEVGTGSGYLAALMGSIAKEVYTIEIIETLAVQAAKRLRELGFQNVFVRAGDGFRGWPEKAPFDAIILTCSPDHVPKPLEKQLVEGGRIVLPLGGEEKFQEILLYTKRSGKIELTKRLSAATFVPMEGEIKTR